MSEVEKMYKNAHIEKVINHECTYDYGITCPNDNDTCENCGYYKEKEPDYPPFTAEKQLAIVCFLINRGVELSFNCEQGKINTQFIQRGLAGLINNRWQDLTSEEQEQIRSILND